MLSGSLPSFPRRIDRPFATHFFDDLFPGIADRLDEQLDVFVAGPMIENGASYDETMVERRG
jgi:hypothetical protein